VGFSEGLLEGVAVGLHEGNLTAEGTGAKGTFEGLQEGFLEG